MILNCTCKHEDQDKIHGNGKRVFNLTKKGTTETQKVYRCTVCERLTEG